MSHLRPLATRTLAVLGFALALLLLELRRTVPSGPAVQMPLPVNDLTTYDDEGWMA